MYTDTIDLPLLYRAIPELRGDLRSDHAGESGAVMIYRGILTLARDPAIRAFATEHLATEAEHLRLLEAIGAERSVLLPIWKIAGFLTGFLPALFGPRAIYATIEAVETFVDHHYAEQIARLDAGPLRDLLVECQHDEVHHRDEAAAALGQGRGVFLRLWGWVVAAGSAGAVAAARKI
jgi:ubiquinone biosynthesis monooxygenase Coq7